MCAASTLAGMSPRTRILEPLRVRPLDHVSLVGHSYPVTIRGVRYKDAYVVGYTSSSRIDGEYKSPYLTVPPREVLNAAVHGNEPAIVTEKSCGRSVA